jgi:acyl dehydratase
MKVGDVFSWQRTFTEEDIGLFSRVSGDQGAHHLEYDGQGRLMAHGLLTATLPTKIGGDMNFIARELCFQFLRPVFAGDTVTCEVTITAWQREDRFNRQSSTWVCRNQHGKEVMTGHAHGIIRNET